MKNKNKEIKKSLELLKKEGYKITPSKEILPVDESKWLKVPELGIEIEIEVHYKDKSWDELNLSEREDELLTAEQCIFLMKPENVKYAKILKMDGSSNEDDFFIRQYSEVSKKSGYVAYFYANSGRSDLNSDGNSGYSFSGRGVRFVRKISKSKK